MLIYLEKKFQNNKIAKNVLSKYIKKDVLLIDNYKNLFDKNIVGTQKCIIIAGVKNAVIKAPPGYGHTGGGYFLKNSLNCIYNCKYCYLHGAFKNSHTVIFVNYDDIKKQILETIKEFRKEDQKNTLWFYASDYSDNLAIDDLTLFVNEFVPFFDTLENVKMEIRTKSVKINNLLNFSGIKNTEIAFSLNPSYVVGKYELGTPSLDMRLQAIHKLLSRNIKVGLRFMPLLEVENYQEIYQSFLAYINNQIDFTQIYSIFIGGLLYTKNDYNKMLKKQSDFALLYKLQDDGKGFYREDSQVRNFFYKLFDSMIKEQKCERCLEQG